MNRSSGTGVWLPVLLFATAASSQGTVRQLTTSQGAMFDWDAVQKSVGCAQIAPQACAQKLKKVLASELATKPLALASHMGCQEKGKPDCTVTFDGCTPKAGLVLAELLKLGAAGAVAAPETVEAYRLSPSLQPLAFRALALWKRPEALPLALERLNSPRVDCRWEAFAAFEQLGPVALPEMVKILETGDWQDRATAAGVLGGWGNPAAVESLLKALTRPPASAQGAAAEALAKLGAPARVAVPELKHLAQFHWSPQVRSAAAKAATALSGAEVLPAPQRMDTPGLTHTDSEWKLNLGGQELKLEGVAGKRRARYADGPCADIGDNAPWGGLVEEAGDCFKLVDGGEWGGALLVREADEWKPLRKTWYLNPYRLVRAPSGAAGELYVLEGMQHMSSAGGIARVFKLPDSRWSAEPVAELPGAPLAFGFDAERRLLVVAENGLDRHGDLETGPKYFLLRLGPDGQLEAAE